MPPSLDQRLAALQNANRIRLVRAEAKRAIKAGAERWDARLDDPDFATMPVFDLLVAVPRIGRTKALTLMTLSRMSEAKTVGGSTKRQRDDLTRHTTK